MHNRLRRYDPTLLVRTVLGPRFRAQVAAPLVAGVVLLIVLILLPGNIVNHPVGMSVAALAALGLAAYIYWGPWETGSPSERAPLTTGAVAFIAAAIWSTGGAHSPLHFLYMVLALYVACLYPRRYVVGFCLLAAAALALPLWYDSDAGFLRLWIAGGSTTAFIAWFTSSLVRSLEHQSRQNTYLQVLSGSAKLLTNLELKQTLNATVRIVQEATGADSCILLLRESDQDVLVSRAFNLAPDYSPEVVQAYGEMRIEPGEGLTGWVFEHGVPVISGDTERDPRAKHIEGTPIEDSSDILAPLLVGGKVTGVIRAGRRGLNQFTDEDLHLLASLAGQAAIAIENARLYQQTSEMAVTDALTGLFNRRYLNRVLEKELMASANRPIALLMIDVYDFKKFNDTLGHLAGDQRLCEIADILRANTRNTDIIARYGGDEFVVVMPDGTMPEALAVKSRIDRAVVHANLMRTPGEPPMTLDIGVDAAKAENIHHLLVRADKKMYEAKRMEDRRHLNDVLEAKLAEREKHAVQAVLSLSQLQELKNPDTRGHAERARQMAMQVARELGLSDDEVQDVGFGAVLHDVGKIVIPPEIINKPGRLTDDEWDLVRKHPEFGANIVGDLTLLERVKPMILHHHERYDGDTNGPHRGYPLGLKGDEIPAGARIIAVVVAYEAMTSQRPYRCGIPREQALAELHNQTGSRFDPKVVEAFSRVIGKLEEDLQQMPMVEP